MPNQPAPSSKWKLALPSEGSVTATPWRTVTGRKKDFEKKTEKSKYQTVSHHDTLRKYTFLDNNSNIRLRQCNDFIVEAISKFWGNCLLTSSENCGVIHEKDGGKSLQRRGMEHATPTTLEESQRAPGIPVPKMCGERNAWGSFLNRNSREAEHDPK